jgi:ATP-dependent NAD(P)H-hydrate dehydratase
MASSLTRAEVLGKVYKMVPPMLDKFHKGIHDHVSIIQSLILT